MLRLWIAVVVARLVGMLSRISGRGGSSLPGIVARRIDPGVFRKLSAKLPSGVILLTGTNGKTTTAAIAAFLLKASGMRIVHNRAGANLILGLTASMVQATRWRIYPQADLALLETDEASIPKAAEETRPKALVVTNFFRDQLDRYGELSTTVGLVKKGIADLDPEGWLVLNADDPQVAFLGEGYTRVAYFGLDLADDEGSGLRQHDAADARFCPRCGQALTYRTQYYAHLGDYHCTHCGWSRPTPNWVVKEWDRGQGRIVVRTDTETVDLPISVPGIYNVYNQLAAVAVASILGAALQPMRSHLESFEPAFGRMEKVEIQGHTIWLALVKNPVGFTQVLQAVGDGGKETARWALLVINDRYADGQDVSWLWDVDFERVHQAQHIDQWWVSGIRAYDMALRLKYAGIPEDHVHVVESSSRALDQMLEAADPEIPIYVMPTYTALLEIRQHLTQQGYTRHFREG